MVTRSVIRGTAREYSERSVHSPPPHPRENCEDREREREVVHRVLYDGGASERGTYDADYYTRVSYARARVAVAIARVRSSKGAFR